MSRTVVSASSAAPPVTSMAVANATDEPMSRKICRSKARAAWLMVRHPSRYGHGARVAALTTIGTIIVLPLMIFVLGPNMPPGKGTDVAKSQVFDNTVLLIVMTPFTVFIIVYVLYSVFVFRADKADPLADGAHIRGHMPSQIAWLTVTTITVLFLAVEGMRELLSSGAGAMTASMDAAELGDAIADLLGDAPQVVAEWMAGFVRLTAMGGHRDLFGFSQKVILHRSSPRRSLSQRVRNVHCANPVPSRRRFCRRRTPNARTRRRRFP